MGIDEVGIDKVGIDEVGRYRGCHLLEEDGNCQCKEIFVHSEVHKPETAQPLETAELTNYIPFLG